jgi:carboxyl-terminal processing protease
VAAGEQILAGMDAGDLVTELAGKTGVTTTVVVRDEDGAGRQVVWMPRAVAAPTVEVSPMGTDALYVRIPVVTAAIDAELAEALSAQGVRAPHSLIVDLRDNPGGDQDALARIAGRLTDGTVWLSVARDGTRQAHKAADSGSPSLDASRVYVLVNEGTADEAEMLAGALRDNNGALLIGKSTFGKGTVQGTEPLADGSLVRLTVARWQTPAGTEPDDVGLKPDKVVPGRDAQLRTARAAALEVSGG